MKVTESRGMLRCGTSRREANITPELLTETITVVSDDGFLPLQRTHMLVCRRRAAVAAYGLLGDNLGLCQ